jgi:hypothetical protein
VRVRVLTLTRPFLLRVHCACNFELLIIVYLFTGYTPSNGYIQRLYTVADLGQEHPYVGEPIEGTTVAEWLTDRKPLVATEAVECTIKSGEVLFTPGLMRQATLNTGIGPIGFSYCLSLLVMWVMCSDFHLSVACVCVVCCLQVTLSAWHSKRSTTPPSSEGACKANVAAGGTADLAMRVLPQCCLNVPPSRPHQPPPRPTWEKKAATAPPLQSPSPSPGHTSVLGPVQSANQ